MIPTAAAVGAGVVSSAAGPSNTLANVRSAAIGGSPPITVVPTTASSEIAPAISPKPVPSLMLLPTSDMTDRSGASVAPSDRVHRRAL